jgi:hypothetical protein
MNKKRKCKIMPSKQRGSKLRTEKQTRMNENTSTIRETGFRIQNLL